MSDALPPIEADTLLYPLKFRPRFVPKMWGGRRLETVLHKPIPAEGPVGESWELFDFPPGVVEKTDRWISATVADGPLAGRTLHELMSVLRHRLLGHVKPVETPAGPQFPILIKFLDAEQDLSVQVHPTEQYAAAHAGASLKNEAWFILAHEPGARLLKGLTDDATREHFESAIQDGTVEDLLISIPAVDGETHYLPSGTVHALGAGMLAAEVQTPSDTTYRVYDFQRVDPSTGEQRELHVEQAMEVIDFDDPNGNIPPVTPAGGEGVIAYAPQFTMSKWTASQGQRKPLAGGVPSVLMILDGTGGVVGENFGEAEFTKGDTLLIPADLSGAQLDPESDCTWIEVTFPA